MMALCLSTCGAAAVAQQPSQTELNKQVLANLAKAGDDGRAVRQIDHFAYPDAPKRASRRSILQWLQSQGFEAEKATQGGVKFSHDMAPRTPLML